MAQVSLPYTLTAGTPENVNNLVANLNALVAGVNTIDTAQLASGSVTSAKLAAGATSATYVTSLPSSAVDGQEIYYAASATNGVIWHLRYRSGSSSSYKWEYVGGVPLTSFIATAETRSSATYGDLSTVGPSITLALAGDYLVRASATITGDTNVWTTAQIAVADDGTAGYPYLSLVANLIDNGGVARSGIATLMGEKVLTSVGAGSVMKMVYASSNGTNAQTFADRNLTITPVRVG